MQNFAKKMCSIILALCVIFSAVFVLPVSAATLENINIGVPTTVTLSSGEVCDVAFTPQESGTYIFYSTDNDYDTVGYAFDSEGNDIAYDDDSGEDRNFSLSCYFVAGNTYTLRSRFYSSSNSGSFNIVIERNPVKSITLSEVNIPEYASGQWENRWDEELEEYVDYFEYDWFSKTTATVEFIDGTVVSENINNAILYKENSFYFDSDSDNTQYDEPWTVGNTYSVTVSFLGIEASTNVTITPSPVKSITIEPVSVIENCDGNWNDYWDDELEQWVPHFSYHWGNKAIANVEFIDGTVVSSCIFDEVEYNGEYYSFSYIDTQTDDPWTLGNTYTMSAWFMGVEFDVPVTITPSPVTSITVEPVTLVEEINGYWSSHWDEEQNIDVPFFYYNWKNNLTATIEFNDGNIVTADYYEDVEYNGEVYSFTCNNDDQASNPWTVGNTYTTTVTFMGKTVEVPITITSSPVTSILVMPITITEGTHGYLSNRWDSELEKNVDYYRYYWYDYAVADIFFNDGTVKRVNVSDSVEYNGEYYSFSTNDDQYNNPWTVGNTYRADVTFMGYTAAAPVTITPSPVTSITVEPVTLPENSTGYWNNYWDDETQQEVTYFNYDWRSKTNATITFDDGTVITQPLNWSVNYGDEYYSFSTTDDQYSNPWTVGNTYTATAIFMGKTVEVPITITPSPVTSVTVEPVTLVENSTGYWDNYWDDETQQEVTYFNYSWQSKTNATITFDNGTVITQPINQSVNYGDDYYSFSTSDNQHYDNPWTVGNTYTATAIFMGKTVEVPITITPSPVESVTVAPITITEYTNGGWSSSWGPGMTEPIEYYRYHWYNKAIATVTFKDGTVITQQIYNSVEYGGNYYDFSHSDEQWIYNQWTVGNTYYGTVSFMGKTVEVPITIEKLPIKSVTIDAVRIPQETKGGWWWINETDKYFHYDWRYNTRVTVEFLDGTVDSSTGNSGVYYNGEFFSFEYNDDQSFETPWTLGNTYTGTITFAGTTYEVPITIIDTPIKSIAPLPLKIPEGTNGYWNYNYDKETGERLDYYNYDWRNSAKVYIEFENGSSTVASVWDGIYYMGSYYDIFTYDDQYTEKWTVGNTYTAQIEIFGKTYDFPVSITESPYKSIEVISADTLKDTNYRWMDSDGNKRYDIPNFVCKITLDDGTVTEYEYTGDYDYYNKPEFDILATETQSQTPWTVDGENLVTVRLGGLTTTFSVEIQDIPDWEYVEQNGGLFITNCGVDERDIVVPDEIDGIPVIGIMSMGDCLSHADSITLPDSVTYISDEAFADASTLDRINLGKNITNLDADMFQYCRSLDEINVSEENESFTTIDGILYNKSGDTLVVYPLGQGNWYDIPDEVVDANVLLVKEYYNDVYINFSENSKAFKEIDGVTYSADMTVVISCDPEKTGSYDMPDSVTNINSCAFQYSSLSEITVSDNVSEIVYMSFSYCNNLETINMPDTITSIAKMAFQGSNLSNLTTLPSSLTEIGFSAFENTSINSINIPGGVGKISDRAFTGSNIETLTLNSGLEFIGNGAFWDNNISELDIPNTVKYIDDCAFCGNNITSLIIPDSVTGMGGSVFSSNPITSLTLGSGLTEISDGAFASSELTSVTIPKNISYIGDYAFEHSPISSVVFEADEVYLGEGTFAYCPLDSTILTDNIKGFGDYAFRGNSMTGVVIPDSVTDITYYSFADSQNLADIDIPDNIQSVNAFAFHNTAWYNEQGDGIIYLEHVLYGYKGALPADGEITVKEGATVIADMAFDTRLDLKTVVLPNGVTTIGDYAFLNCIGLKKIVIPSSVTNIGKDAFTNCLDLTIYGAEDSYAEQYAADHGIPFAVLVEKQVDEVKISTTTAVIDKDAELIVESTPQEEVTETLPEEIKATNVVAFDIYFELEGEEIQPEGIVTVTIDLPVGFDPEHSGVYHIADDGTITNMNAVFKNGKLVFDTTHFSVYAVIETKPAIMYGDTNGDGKINTRDTAMLMQYINGWDVQIDIDAADVNGDGKQNSRDYAMLMQYVNGWDVTLGPKS